ncbi:MAG TPA: PAS domain S-box protein [Terracidiphilus sp.]|jgi:PAS domain S-box-containing protein
MSITRHETLEHWRDVQAANGLDAASGLDAANGLDGARFTQIFARAPVAIALLSGPDHHFTYVNEPFVRAAGRPDARSLLGLPVRKALPELESSGVFEFLDEVYRTTTAHRGCEFDVALGKAEAGSQNQRFSNLTFQPLRDSAGAVEAVLLMAADLTERVSSYRQLEESELRFRMALEAAHVGSWEWDPVENKRVLSPELQRMYDIDPSASDAEILKAWSSRVHPMDWPYVQLQMAECQRTGVLDLEYRFEHPERGLRHHHTRGKRMLGTSRFFGVVSDITDRKRAEQSLSQREEEFRILADAMPQLVWMADPTGYVHWFNQRWYDYTGTTAEQNCGWGWQSVHDPKFLPDVLVRWNASLQTGNPFEMVFPLRDKNGKYKPFLTRAVPVRDSGGSVLRWFGTNTDISGEFEIRRQIEESQAKLQTALSASQRLAAIVSSSDDAIIGKDLNGIVTSWNPCAERMFGYSASEMMGISIRKVIPPDVFPDEDRIMSAVARGERTEHFETIRLRKDGERLEVSLTLSPVFDEEGRIVGVASISRDISQQNKVEKALHTSERLASVGRLAATIAHEINNPLEAVTNLVYLAQNSLHEGEAKVFLEQAQQELARVALLTKQTLGFYRENKGARELTLAELVAPLVTVFSARARNKQIAIDTDFRQNPTLVGIPGEIRQLFANLLNNSIDAVRDRGRILIRISEARESWEMQRRGVRLTICDNGPGIPQDIRRKLFEPFFTTKRDVGTGLGLWVISNILRNHEGNIRVRSSTRPGMSWTVFSVFLPVNSQARSQEMPAQI